MKSILYMRCVVRSNSDADHRPTPFEAKRERLHPQPYDESLLVWLGTIKAASSQRNTSASSKQTHLNDALVGHFLEQDEVIAFLASVNFVVELPVVRRVCSSSSSGGGSSSGGSTFFFRFSRLERAALELPERFRALLTPQRASLPTPPHPLHRLPRCVRASALVCWGKSEQTPASNTTRGHNNSSKHSAQRSPAAAAAAVIIHLRSTALYIKASAFRASQPFFLF